MTTATDPPQTLPLIDEPSIGVDELPAWNQPDERVCEMVVEATLAEHRCGKPAAWVVSGRCRCDIEAMLMCAPCKRLCIDEGDGMHCVDCRTDVTITWIEAL